MPKYIFLRVFGLNIMSVLNAKAVQERVGIACSQIFCKIQISRLRELQRTSSNYQLDLLHVLVVRGHPYTNIDSLPKILHFYMILFLIDNAKLIVYQIMDCLRHYCYWVSCTLVRLY